MALLTTAATIAPEGSSATKEVTGAPFVELASSLRKVKLCATIARRVNSPDQMQPPVLLGRNTRESDGS